MIATKSYLSLLGSTPSASVNFSRRNHDSPFLLPFRRFVVPLQCLRDQVQEAKGRRRLSPICYGFRFSRCFESKAEEAEAAAGGAVGAAGGEPEVRASVREGGGGGGRAPHGHVLGPLRPLLLTSSPPPPNAYLRLLLTSRLRLFIPPFLSFVAAVVAGF
uniref:UDP-N-acetylglucosamine 1-carboxyvinyltransferase n=1 Tax=Anthurium amnicola TaxID=1678845 RepID=A0A1D1ZL85_9ARAE